nr:MAG TPA: hypothetical protein [Caudoviricetes sp.]
MEQVREDGRHGGKIFGVGCLQVVATSVCGLVQLVENGVNLAVIKEKVVRIPAGAQSVVQFRQLIGCGKVAHTTGPVEDERQTVSDGGNVLFGKLNARHGKTSCYSVVSGCGPMSARPGGAAGLAPAAAGCRRPCGSFRKHLAAKRFDFIGGADGQEDKCNRGLCGVLGVSGVHGRIAGRFAVVDELRRVNHAIVHGVNQDRHGSDVVKACKSGFLFAGGQFLQERRALHSLFRWGMVLEKFGQIGSVLLHFIAVLPGNDGHAVFGAFAERGGLDNIQVQHDGDFEPDVRGHDVNHITTAGNTHATLALALILQVCLNRLHVQTVQGEITGKFHVVILRIQFSNCPGGVPGVGRGRFSGCGPARVSHSAERSLFAVCRGAVCAGSGGCFGLGLCFGCGCGGLRRTLCVCDGLPGIAPLCQRFRLGGAVLFGHGHKFPLCLAFCLLECGHAGHCFLLGSRCRLCGGLGLVLLGGGSLCGFALVCQHLVICPDVIKGLKALFRGFLRVALLDLPASEKVGGGHVVVTAALLSGCPGQRVSVGGQVFGLGAVLVLPELAADHGLFAALDAQPAVSGAFPAVERVEKSGAKGFFCNLHRIGCGAVFARLHNDFCGGAGDLVGGVVVGGQLVQLFGGVLGTNGGFDKIIVPHGVKPPVFSSQIVPAVCQVWGGAALRCNPARASGAFSPKERRRHPARWGRCRTCGARRLCSRR